MIRPAHCLKFAALLSLGLIVLTVDAHAQVFSTPKNLSNNPTAPSADPNPVPQINQPLVPGSALPGGPGFTLTVNGTGFVSASVVKWNGSARTTTFVNSRQLTAAISASDITKVGTAWVTVSNPSPGGGTSNVAFFLVTSPTSSIDVRRSDFTTGQQPMLVTTGDFNGDGKLDLVLANQNCVSLPCPPGSVSILLGNGDGTFQPHVDYPVGLQPFSVATGDFNGDGKLDLAVANTSGSANTISILLGNGDGTFQPHVDYATGTNPISVAAADFNGDGKLDLVVANRSSNSVSILLGNGDGTFQTRVEYATANGSVSVATGDFNGDGRLDLAVVGNTFPAIPSTVSILLGNGDGTFQGHVDYPVGNNSNIVTIADFNGDGKLDLAVSNLASRTVSILLGSGDGTFQQEVEYFTRGQATSVTSGDFNGDGKLDLAVTSNDPNIASILLSNGDGTFQPHMDFGVGSFPTSLTAGDFNGDGRLDVAVANGGSNTVSVLLQSGTFVVPVANAGLDQTVECTGHTATPLTLDGSKSSDPDGDLLSFVWKDSANNVVGTTAVVSLALPLGMHTFALTVTDPGGLSSTATTHISVVDTTSPTLRLSLSPNILWPPNHNLVQVTATIEVRDTCDPNPTVEQVSITSNEPDNGLGDGDMPNDIQGAIIGTDERSFFLRAERSGTGTGRIYTVTYRAKDASGNTTLATAQVRVPHDRN